MNVIVANQQQAQLSTLDIDLIKSITGAYTPFEIVEMFQNFFYNKMVLDVTAIKGYDNIQSYQTIAKGLDVDKVIFYLPEGTSLCTPNFLAKLITLGIYNFTTNADGVKYLIKNSNTLKDVEHIQKMGGGGVLQKDVKKQEAQIQKHATEFSTILGLKNSTDQAGSTTLAYMLKKELTTVYGDRVVALEINKKDFQVFNEKNMLSVTPDSIRATIEKYRGKAVIIIDLADYDDLTMCTEVLYLVEPSTIKLNKLIKKNTEVFNKLKTKKVVLNKSLLDGKDLSEFEYEAGLKVFYNMPPLNERKKNEAITNLLVQLGLIQVDGDKKNNSKIFGLFRR